MFVLVFNTTKTTIILYQLTTTICLLTIGFNQGKYRFSIIKNIGQNDYIPEHQAFVDCSFTLGRIVSYGFLLIVGLTGSMVLQQILLITFILTVPIETVINYKLDKEDAFLLTATPKTE